MQCSAKWSKSLCCCLAERPVSKDALILKITKKEHRETLKFNNSDIQSHPVWTKCDLSKFSFLLLNTSLVLVTRYELTINLDSGILSKHLDVSYSSRLFFPQQVYLSDRRKVSSFSPFHKQLVSFCQLSDVSCLLICDDWRKTTDWNRKCVTSPLDLRSGRVCDYR